MPGLPSGTIEAIKGRKKQWKTTLCDDAQHVEMQLNRLQAEGQEIFSVETYSQSPSCPWMIVSWGYES